MLSDVVCCSSLFILLPDYVDIFAGRKNRCGSCQSKSPHWRCWGFVSKSVYGTSSLPEIPQSYESVWMSPLFAGVCMEIRHAIRFRLHLATCHSHSVRVMRVNELDYSLHSCPKLSVWVIIICWSAANHVVVFLSVVWQGDRLPSYNQTATISRRSVACGALTLRQFLVPVIAMLVPHARWPIFRFLSGLVNGCKKLDNTLFPHFDKGIMRHGNSWVWLDMPDGHTVTGSGKHIFVSVDE